MLFNSFESLKIFIDTDIKSSDISCVRYINVETMDMWVKVKAYLTNVCSDFIKLSDFCEEEDTTPNIIRLKSKIKKISNNTLLTPLSEHLRISNSSAYKTFEEILKLDYVNNINNNLKIYIPVYRMKSLLTNLIDEKRYKKSILFLETQADCDYSLTIVQDTLNVKIKGNEIKGYKKYLTYWEQNPDKPIILHTQNAVHYADIVFADDVRVIVNAYELLKYHHKFNDIGREWGTDEQWTKLIKYLSDTKNLEQAFMNILLVPRFDIRILDQWNNKNSFEKWIFWLWAKHSKLDGYLKIVIDRSNSAEEFERLIYNSVKAIVNHEHYIKLYLERKAMIKAMNLKPTAEFWDNIDELDVCEKLKCLTNSSEKERNKIFSILRETTIDENVQSILKITYPDLGLYLSAFNLGSDELNSYFTEYKIQKIRNTMFDYFEEKVKEIAKKQYWWDLKPRNVLINQFYDDKKVIFYVDALGVEYLNLLVDKIEKSRAICNVYIGYCNIPSTTKHNNDFYVGKNNKKTYELDELKHKNNVYPENVVKELNMINTIANDAVSLLEDYEQVIIASDHGTSRLAVLADNKVIPASESADIYKYGRYCIDETMDYSKYDSCIEKNGFWTWADYSRFPSQGAPLGETHGGALLEEVLVPVIIVSNACVIDDKDNSKIIITLLTEQVKLLPSKKVKVEFKLSEQLQNVEAVVNNKRYLCTFCDGIYSFEPDVDRRSEYIAKIVSKEIIGTINYKIIKGLTSNLDI